MSLTHKLDHPAGNEEVFTNNNPKILLQGAQFAAVITREGDKSRLPINIGQATLTLQTPIGRHTHTQRQKHTQQRP